MKNINGIARFEHYLVKLDALFLKATDEKNPALWLYSNDARTTFFMLEALGKLYEGLHNRHRFEKIKEHFKELEDGIGAIDYYDNFAKEFANNPAIPVPVTEYLQAQTREKLQRLNDVLIEKKWIGEKASRMSKIRKKLADADWDDPKDELKAIFNFYKSSIREIKIFMQETGDGFTGLEAQVHAIRRKLRWLSIYPQALQGVVQLNEIDPTPPQLLKYLTPDIVNSSFNKMPAGGNNPYFLLLNKNYFLALSWLINELGNLKDSGLRILAVAEALQQTNAVSQEVALEQAIDIFGGDKDMLNKILDKATGICKIFFTEQNLDKLIHGITSAKKT